VVRTVKDNGVESMSSNGCVEDEIRDQVEAIYDDIPLAALLRHPLLRHPAQSPREVLVSAVVAVVAVHCLLCYQLMVVVGHSTELAELGTHLRDIAPVAVVAVPRLGPPLAAVPRLV